MSEKQYVVFNLQNEEYAIEIKRVHEVNRLKEIKITKVPKVPYFIEGIINLRGDVIPIVNLRKKFNLENRKINKETRIVIVAVNSKMAGLLVDSVSHVISIYEDEILLPPDEVKLNYNYITGVAKRGKKVIFILDINKILNIEKENINAAK